MRQYVILFIIILLIPSAITLAEKIPVYYSIRQIKPIQSTITPTAWLDYTAVDTSTYKDEVKGRLYLNDVDIPDPNTFGGTSGIWTHVALARSNSMDYLVEIGVRRIEINWFFYVEVVRQIFITYHDINGGKRTDIIKDDATLGTYYYVRNARSP